MQARGRVRRRAAGPEPEHGATTAPDPQERHVALLKPVGRFEADHVAVALAIRIGSTAVVAAGAIVYALGFAAFVLHRAPWRAAAAAAPQVEPARV